MSAPTGIIDRPRATVGHASHLRAELAPRGGPARFVTAVGVVMLLAAALHLVVFVFDDTPWAGAVSWRKPIVFFLSVGLLLWSFGWVLDRLPKRSFLAWSLAGAFALFSAIEVGIIALQQWRGRPSHFNTMANDDAVLFGIMGGAVAVMALALIGLFLWSLIERPGGGAGPRADPRLERSAIWFGLGLVMLGLGIGQWLLNLGFAYVDSFDAVPDSLVYGEAGAAKFPHAVAFHGIQVFMVATALLSRPDLDPHRGRQLMRVVIAGYIGLMIFASLQTLDGRGPLDLAGPLAALLTLSILGLGGALVTMTHRFVRT